MKFRQASYAAILAVTALLMAQLSCRGRKAENSCPPLVKFATAIEYSKLPSSTYSAITEAEEQSDLAFRVSGVIADTYVRPGDAVRRGDPIASLDDRDYKVQLAATEAEYKQIRAEVERISAMHDDNAVSDNDYDKARYGLEQISQKQQLHSSQLADCILRAPDNGYIAGLNCHSGESVMAGIPVVSFIGHAVGITFRMSYSDYIRRGTFDSITAEFAEIPGRKYNLSIAHSSPVADNNQLYDVHLTMDGQDDGITPGMVATVTVRFKASDENFVVVPVSSLFHRDGTTRLYLYDETNSRLVESEVSVINILSDGTAIVCGIDAGTEVAAAGVSGLHDGETVRKVASVSKSNPGGLL